MTDKITQSEREKKITELLEKTQNRYKKLKDGGKLNRRGKHVNVLNAFNVELARDLLKAHLVDGKTKVPIDLKAYWESCGVKMDYNHTRDKVRRYFEMLVLKDYIDSEKADKIQAFYSKETTEILRSVFQTGNHFITESNKETEDTFLHIDIRDLLKSK